MYSLSLCQSLSSCQETVLKSGVLELGIGMLKADRSKVDGALANGIL